MDSLVKRSLEDQGLIVVYKLVREVVGIMLQVRKSVREEMYCINFKQTHWD